MRAGSFLECSPFRIAPIINFRRCGDDEDKDDCDSRTSEEDGEPEVEREEHEPPRPCDDAREFQGNEQYSEYAQEREFNTDVCRHFSISSFDL